MIRYFPASGDRLGWAIDEDLRLIRRALRGEAAESTLGCADIVHAPFWVWLPKILHDPEVLRRKFVIAHADNPPFFYLTQPEFAWAQEIVDLWVARSTEAQTQFEKLGLRSIHIPYAIDTGLFFPIIEKQNIREKYGLPKDVYIIGNFHRDSEGSDLSKPKQQKAPEMMLAIFRRLQQKGKKFHILLAGPRRHWIRRALTQEQISFTFVGKQIEQDDIYDNILSRHELNKLYNACDLYLITSRWEGGPQSVMEASAARIKILSPTIGVARDILEAESLFDYTELAAEKISRDMETNFLAPTLDKQYDRICVRHNAVAMAKEIQKLYQSFSKDLVFRKKKSKPRRYVSDSIRNTILQLKSKVSTKAIVSSVKIAHQFGEDKFLDEALENLREILETLGIATNGDSNKPVIAGHYAGKADFRVLPPGDCGRVTVHPETVHVALSVKDAIAFRQKEAFRKVLVCPLLLENNTNENSVCVIDPCEQLASLKICRAILANRPIVYPNEDVYYYQVFHGGIAYDKNRTVQEALKIAKESYNEITKLAIKSDLEKATWFWKSLLLKNK